MNEGTPHERALEKAHLLRKAFEECNARGPQETEAVIECYLAARASDPEAPAKLIERELPDKIWEAFDNDISWSQWLNAWDAFS